MRCYEVGLDYQAISDHSVYSTSEDMKRKFSRFPTSMSFFNAEECHYSHAHIQNFGGSQSLTEYVKKNRGEFDALVAEIEKTLPADVSAVVRRNVAVAEAEFDFIRRLGPSEYVVEASMHLDDLNDLLGLSLESEDYDSIGGFMIGMLDHLPEQGEEVIFQNLRLVADQVDGNRIDKVHIYLTEEPKEQPEEETAKN